MFLAVCSLCLLVFLRLIYVCCSIHCFCVVCVYYCCELFVACCSVLVVCSLLLVDTSLLSVVRCVLCVAYSALFALCVVGCLSLFGCLLCSECC